MKQPIRILIADDSARARGGLRALLTMRPELDVIGMALNGAEAVRLVEEQHPDVVLMDIRMPVLDGLEATRQIKEQWPEITVVVLTAYTGEHAKAFAAGADTVVVKGSDTERLLSALGIGVHAP